MNNNNDKGGLFSGSLINLGMGIIQIFSDIKIFSITPLTSKIAETYSHSLLFPSLLLLGQLLSIRLWCHFIGRLQCSQRLHHIIPQLGLSDMQSLSFAHDGELSRAYRIIAFGLGFAGVYSMNTCLSPSGRRSFCVLDLATFSAKEWNARQSTFKVKYVGTANTHLTTGYRHEI